MKKPKLKIPSARLKVGDWVVAAYVRRFVCLAGPAIAPNGYPIIYDRRWRLGFVEERTIIFYGSEQAARHVFQTLEQLDERQMAEEKALHERHVDEVRATLPALVSAFKSEDSTCRAELGASTIYGCFDWSYLTWTGRDPLPDEC